MTPDILKSPKVYAQTLFDHGERITDGIAITDLLKASRMTPDYIMQVLSELEEIQTENGC